MIVFYSKHRYYFVERFIKVLFSTVQVGGLRSLKLSPRERVFQQKGGPTYSRRVWISKYGKARGRVV